MRYLSMLAIGLLTLTPATALSADDNTLFLNLGDDWYLNPALVEEGGSGQAGIVSNPVADSPQTDNAPLAPELAQVVELDPDGMVEVVLNIESEAGITVEGQRVPVVLGGAITIDCRLELGTVVVADCTPQDHTLVPGESIRANWSIAPAVTTLDPADGNLNLWFEVRGAATGALPVAGGEDPARVVLPVLGGGGGLEVLFGDATLPLEHAFEEPTTAVHQLNWTAPFANATFDLGGEAVNGSAVVTVLDAAGEAVFEGGLGDASAAPAGPTTATGTAGAWSIRIDYSDFVGSLRLDITEHVVTPDGDAPDAVQEPEGTNETEPALSADVGGEDAPGLPVVLGLLAVAAVAVLRRRD